MMKVGHSCHGLRDFLDERQRASGCLLVRGAGAASRAVICQLLNYLRRTHFHLLVCGNLFELDS